MHEAKMGDIEQRPQANCEPRSRVRWSGALDPEGQRAYKSKTERTRVTEQITGLKFITLGSNLSATSFDTGKIQVQKARKGYMVLICRRGKPSHRNHTFLFVKQANQLK